MITRIILLTSVLLCAAAACGQDQPAPPQPQLSVQAVAAHDAALEKASDAYQVAVSDADKTLITDLRKALRAASADGSATEVVRIATMLEEAQTAAQTPPAPTPATNSHAPRMSATIYAQCDDCFEMAINGRKVAAGGFVLSDCTIGIGDTICVRVVNAGGPRGFKCVIKLNDGKQVIASDVDKWKCYVPKHVGQWYLPSEVHAVRNAQHGTNNNMGSMRVAAGVDATCIWGYEETSFLVLRVSKDAINNLK
jgi:hypothetical protein